MLLPNRYSTGIFDESKFNATSSTDCNYEDIEVTDHIIVGSWQHDEILHYEWVDGMGFVLLNDYTYFT